MQTFHIDIKTRDGLCDSFVAYPKGEQKFPAVLLFMDAFGPRPYLYEMAEILAASGYFVLLPNLFYRSRRAPVIDVTFPISVEVFPEAHKQIRPLLQALSDEHKKNDVGDFLHFLTQQKQVLPGQMGLTGYCMGGALALRAAAWYPEQVAVAASFHTSRLVTDEPDSFHHMLKKIKAELYIAHADNDPSMPADKISILAQALAESGLRYEAETYTHAAHGFTMRDLPAYNVSALKKHWEKLPPLLARNLKD